MIVVVMNEMKIVVEIVRKNTFKVYHYIYTIV